MNSDNWYVASFNLNVDWNVNTIFTFQETFYVEAEINPNMVSIGDITYCLVILLSNFSSNIFVIWILIDSVNPRFLNVLQPSVGRG